MKASKETACYIKKRRNRDEKGETDEHEKRLERGTMETDFLADNNG